MVAMSTRPFCSLRNNALDNAALFVFQSFPSRHPAQEMQTVSDRLRIDEIIVGDRVRKDMGDLKSLADSMQRHGLLHPVVVKTDHTLIAGHRRIEAAKMAGWTDIAVTVIDVADLLMAERDENTERKKFSPTEAVEIGQMIEHQHRTKIVGKRHEWSSKAGQISAGKRSGNEDVKDILLEKVGHTTDVVGKAVGMSGATYFRAKAVVSAATSDPEQFGDLAKFMDETGSVLGAHQELQRRKGKNDKTLRHPVHRKTHFPQPNREMERAIPTLDGICSCIEEIKPSELDQSKRKQWSGALKKFAARLHKTARRLYGNQ